MQSLYHYKTILSQACLRTSSRLTIPASRAMSSAVVESDAEFDARYEAYFNRKDIDGWEIRKVMPNS